jgi:protease I
VEVDKTVKEADPEDYDGLLIPGGFINPDMLRQSADARDFVRAFDSADKPNATLCHGPWVLASAGLLDGRVLTSWPGVRDDMVNAGAKWLDRDVVWDGNLVTSRGPQDLVPFVRALKKHFAEGASLDKKTRAMRSAPQHDEAPRVVQGFMKALPLPKFKTLLTLGAIAGGVYALTDKESIKAIKKQLKRAA